MLIIIVVFTIISAVCIIYIYNKEKSHLEKNVEAVIKLKEAELDAILLEPETLLKNYAEIIRNMLLRGDDENIITEYMINTTNYISKNEDFLSALINIHGYFYEWGGKYLSGKNNVLPHDFTPQNSLWYQSAINANGELSLSGPDKETGDNTLTLSKLITDNNGDPLAVICISFELNRFSNYHDINLTNNSYGILLNNQRIFISYEDKGLIGESLIYKKTNVAGLYGDLRLGIEFKNERVRDSFLSFLIVSFRKVKYDWYLGIVFPANEYSRNIGLIAIIIISISLFLTCGLCFMLYFISQAKTKSDIRTQQKSNFLATMSHEIRTPLNAILGMTEIQIQNSSHPPSTSESFIKINNSGKLLLNIINDILDLSKIESGKLELVPVKYEVASMINDIIQLNYIRYESRPIEFKVKIDENIPAILVGDELRIKQILNNLLSNAFKYTSQGEVMLAVNAECVGRGGGAVLVTLIFQIIDTGQGMTSDQINRLFDEYTRFNLEANRTTEGAGLGMTITRNLVNLMYGKISVKSEIDAGTTVTVHLPQKTDGIGIRGIIGKETAENLQLLKHDNAIQLKKTKITHEYMPYGNILIVDDVETNLFVAKGLMSPYGLKIDLATSGFEAINKIKEGFIYDIIFMDHMMPKMDGIEATKIIRNRGYNYPIVALTANAIAGQADMFLKNGFDDFISKPIDLRQLNLVLNKLIRDKQPQEVIIAAQKEKEEMEKKQAFGQGHQHVNLQLAGIFARDAEKAIKVLKTCVVNNLQNETDIQMYIINVHAMKSALANIGEKKLSNIAERLEQAGREKDIGVLLSETDDFLNSLNVVVNEIAKKNNDDEIAEDTEDSLAFLNEKLLIIKEACTTLDKKSAKNALSELREKTWSQNIKKLIDSIAEHLLHSDFDETSVLVENYLK